MLRPLPAAAALAIALALLVAGLVRTPTAADLVPVDASPELAAYLRTCATCHPPYDARTHRRGEWRGVVTEMHRRAGDRAITMDPQQLESAIQYLEAHGRP